MKNAGTLSVRVYASQAELPLKGATVVVTQSTKTGKYELLSVQATDSSGMIRPIEIVTPGSLESTEPNNGENGVPYALCNVWAEYPGYAMLQVDGVQIFPGVETIQNMEMIPLAEGQNSLQQRDVRDITSQNL